VLQVQLNHSISCGHKPIANCNERQPNKALEGLQLISSTSGFLLIQRSCCNGFLFLFDAMGSSDHTLLRHKTLVQSMKALNSAIKGYNHRDSQIRPFHKDALNALLDAECKKKHASFDKNIPSLCVVVENSCRSHLPYRHVDQ
jgi:hypothetical protein